jgi:carboxymethylenebutenolidase
MSIRHCLVLLVVILALLVDPRASAPADAVRASEIEIAGSEGEVPARLYLPGAGEPRPALLVLHTANGPGPNVEAVARALAAEGYVALAPDLFNLHDFGAEGRTDHPLILGDLDAALDHLARHPSVDAGRLGVIGFSFGGRLAVLLAARKPDRIRAVVAYYAVTDHGALGRPLAGRAAHARPLSDHVAAIRAPVLLQHGDADRNVPVEQSRLLHRALVAAGKTVELATYPGADHLFDFTLGPEARPHPEAARTAWRRTLDFLRRHLR